MLKIKMFKIRLSLLLIVLFLFLVSCNEIGKKEINKTLSELQVTACNSADEAKTCDTRLSEVGIVSKEDCCNILKKCC